MRKGIITGSRGLIGKSVFNYFKNNYDLIEFDITLGDDLTDEEYVKKMFFENKADFLINLFALNDHIEVGRENHENTLFDVSLNSFRKYLEVNLTALFSVCREFARNNSKGVIINFSSTYGMLSPRPHFYGSGEKHIGYGVSKSGVIQLTRHLATHLAPDFRVNCVVPGGVRHNQDTSFQKKYSQNTPLGRMMEPAEIIGVLEFLCSEKSSYATGGVFVIDGGWSVI